MRALKARLLLGCAALAVALGAAAPARAHDVEGELYGVHADDFDAGTSTTDWRLETAHGTVDVLPTALPALTAGHNEVEVADQDPGPGVVGPVAAVTAAAPQLGGRKLAVIAFRFAPSLAQPWTTADIETSIFTGAKSASQFYREESQGRLWFTGKSGNTDGDVYGWYTLPPPTGCSTDYPNGDVYRWANLAEAEAVVNGFDENDYDHVMFVFPPYSGCKWAGLGEIGGKYSWINGGDNGDLSVRVTAHELGHNLGLHHAGSWDCRGTSEQRVPISSRCTLNEYNDPFDVMGGFGGRHNSGWHLEQLGLLPGSNLQTVQAGGTYTLSAGNATTPPTGLRVASRYAGSGGTKEWYYLEARRAGGVFENFLATDPVATGVSVRLNDDPSRTEPSRLIDVDVRNGISDSAVQPGESFSDGRISVTTLSAANGAATVYVNMAAPPLDEQVPAPPSGLSHVLLAPGLRLRWNPSGDNVGVRSYSVSRDGMEIGTTGALSFDDLTVTTGRHVYTVSALDAAGNQSAASAPYVVDVPQPTVRNEKASAADRKAPRLRLYRKRLRQGVLRLTAKARDASGIARMELRIDGRRVSAKRASRLSYRWHQRRGRHKVVLVAYDKRGNRATFRLSLRVRA